MRWRAIVESLGRYANARVEGLGRTGRFAADTGRATLDVATWGPVATYHARTLGVG